MALAGEDQDKASGKVGADAANGAATPEWEAVVRSAAAIYGKQLEANSAWY